MVVIIVVLIAIVFYFSGKKEPEKTEKRYEILNLKDSIDSSYIEVNGNVEVNDTKKVFVDKKLKVKEVFIQEGDYVEKGQILMSFDEDEKNSVKRNIEKEQLNYNKLEREYKIAKELYSIGGTSFNEVKTLEENMRKSQLTLEEYQEDLSKTAEKIESPVSGTITSLTAQENYLVNTDSPLLEIADLSDIKIILEVPEYEIKNVRLNQKIVIKPEVFEKKKSFYGKVTKISKISKVSKITGENIVNVEVKPNETIPYLVPGFKVIGNIYINEETKGVVIPKSALLLDETNNSYFVYKLDNENKAFKTVVKIDNTPGSSVVINSGLEKEDRILVAPDYQIVDGQVISGKESGNVRNKKIK